MEVSEVGNASILRISFGQEGCVEHVACFVRLEWVGREWLSWEHHKLFFLLG